MRISKVCEAIELQLFLQQFEELKLARPIKFVYSLQRKLVTCITIHMYVANITTAMGLYIPN